MFLRELILQKNGPLFRVARKIPSSPPTRRTGVGRGSRLFMFVDELLDKPGPQSPRTTATQPGGPAETIAANPRVSAPTHGRIQRFAFAELRLAWP